MSFKYSVIGDNTAENREHLLSLGIKEKSEHGEALVSMSGSHSITVSHKGADKMLDKLNGFIDTRDNDPLFRALTAVRDDSDYMQWFVSYDYGADWRLSFQDKWDCNNTDWHKATKEELMEHFKI